MTSFVLSWNDLWLPPINLWNAPMIDKKYKTPCPICGREKSYSTEINYKKLKDKPCKSCSNSISGGGTGYKEKCQCGNQKYKNSSTYCSECLAKNCKKYHSEYYKYAKYGTTKEWYDTEVKKGCAICNTDLTNKKVHIDHCHSSGKVRGVLCELCNKGLGQFKDNISSLENAIKYLKERN